MPTNFVHTIRFPDDKTEEEAHFFKRGSSFRFPETLNNDPALQGRLMHLCTFKIISLLIDCFGKKL